MVSSHCEGISRRATTGWIGYDKSDQDRLGIHNIDKKYTLFAYLFAFFVSQKVHS